MNKQATNLECYLIGQLAKNDNYKDSITGKEILEYALNIIQQCYKLIGLRVVLVECQNKPKLLKFYHDDNSFQQISTDSETNLIQLVRTISNKEKVKVQQLFEDNVDVNR